MTDDFFPETPSARPIWLVTLADLALLLVGFFVLIQANQTLDGKALAQGLREGFGVTTRVADPMPVAVAAMADFAPGSSVLPSSPASIIAWARSAATDPRVQIKITGATDGTPADVEPVTRSASVLAADRARAVAAALASAGAVPADRLTIANDSTPGRRTVTLTIGFGGERP
ncbi:OmpA family protein [Sphingomonas sp. 28-62-11]|uniref:OmpA family protein n=1 Tax=Sphingomonas sp. 28-62-11 TaxID=1970432 RepID=UPI0035A8ACFF